MIEQFMHRAVGATLSIVLGIFVINILCENFLSFSPINALRRLINKITGNKEED